MSGGRSGGGRGEARGIVGAYWGCGHGHGEQKEGGSGETKNRATAKRERGAGQRGGTKGVEQRVGVSKDCTHWVTGPIWVAHFVWEIRSVPGPPIQRGRPGTHRRTHECTGKPAAPNRRRRVYVGSEEGRGPPPPQNWGGAGATAGASCKRILPCQAGCLSVTDGAVGSRTCGTPASGTGAAAHPSCADGSPCFLVKRGLLRCAGVTEARGPLGPRHRWSLWIIGRWPVLIPRFPGGAAPREPPFVGVSAGSGPPTRGPYAAGHTAPVRAAWWNTLRVDRCLRGYSGGNWMVTFFASPRCAGGLSRWPGARSPLPVYT